MATIRQDVAFGDEETKPKCGWLEAIVIVTFHVEHGQIVEDVFSLGGPLSESSKRKICSLSLPDSNSGQNGDVQFIFRYRDGDKPVRSIGSVDEEEFVFCSAFFRQIKDKTVKRGYFQKSVVLVSKLPVTSFLEDCAYIIGPLFFEFGKDVLQAILRNLKKWPQPEPGKSFSLPIAGCTIDATIPTMSQMNHSSFQELQDGVLLSKRNTVEVVVEGAQDGDTEEAQPKSPKIDATLHISSLFDRDSDMTSGLFQEIPLFSTFGGLSVALWHIWELALSGDPVLVLAPTPDRCSQAVLAIAGLIAPIVYNGDYRPYFTIYDPDFMEVSRKHDELQGQNMPSVVLGVTNPYFLKTLEFWPNVISMGGIGPSTTALARSLTPPPDHGAMDVGSPPSSPPQVMYGRQAAEQFVHQSSATRTEKEIKEMEKRTQFQNEAKYQRVVSSSQRRIHRSGSSIASAYGGSTSSLSIEGKNIKTARYCPTIATRGASLRALLTDQKYERSIILTRDEPKVSPNFNVLRQLLDENDAEKANMVLDGEENCIPRSALCINNKLLRQHFRLLTRAFLRPLESYFKLEAVASRAAKLSGVSISAYDQSGLVLDKFDVEEFLAQIKPPKALQRIDYYELYRKFIKGPNFESWFRRQRMKLEFQLRYIYRHLRLNTDPDVLLQAAGANSAEMRKVIIETVSKERTSQHRQPPGEAKSENVKGFRLYMRVKQALDSERAKPVCEQDTELCEKMQEHLDVVHSLLSSCA
uniref:UDENN domain-containing protein n=1 Tax=Mucochytrium quahogii TaxID=96639 RepID=A0A7S2SJA1_9STRA|mmetsp:Transcript_120/g.280  ORF Transcript_120/g.280 Transcript_120/m.280 type:complete len:751 (-) Transcript_120:1514-3766(-)|eukprot:CAMPEP_0203794380 /NCGR_PEP_ID=MMETSP0100_2-20121128/6475_1 /ASSEMBLY_ACC=CAM_ASM_000210 /TAXON_ID=96639 /ORGANISM=" , Strain NY0313808BC1" /LENGTH=750 /DNA_ID=CAMNT_0050698437 /DNA_START=648 /DNA_END=2900 /DNA_ORIENTATION=+